MQFTTECSSAMGHSFEAFSYDPVNPLGSTKLPSAIAALAVSASSGMIAAAEGGSSARANTGWRRPRHPARGFAVGRHSSARPGSVDSLAFSPSGKQLAVTNSDGTLVVFDLASHTHWSISVANQGGRHAVGLSTWPPRALRRYRTRHRRRRHPQSAQQGFGISGDDRARSRRRQVAGGPIAITIAPGLQRKPRSSLTGPTATRLGYRCFGCRTHLQFIAQPRRPADRHCVIRRPRPVVPSFRSATHGGIANWRARVSSVGSTVEFLDNDHFLFVSNTGFVVIDLSPVALVFRACSVADRNLTRQEFAQYLGTIPYHRTCPQWRAPR